MTEKHPCFTKMRADEKFKGLSDEQLDAAATYMESIAKDANYTKLAKQYRTEMVMEATRREYTNKWDALRKAEIENDVRDTLMTGVKGQDIFEALAGGTWTSDRNAGVSYRGVKDSFKGNMQLALRKVFNGKESLFRNGDLDLEVAKAYDNLKQGLGVENFPKHVQEVAAGLKNFNAMLLKRLQNAGIYIRESADYLWKQTHDPEKIMAVSKNEWVDNVHNRLDLDKTFGATKDINLQKNILKDIYREFTDSNYIDVEGYYTGHRELFFKTPEDFVMYSKEFGRGTMTDIMQKTIDSASKHYANNMVLSSKPKEAFYNLERYVENWLGVNRPKELQEFIQQRRRRENLAKAMFGYNDHPANNLIEKITHASTQLQVLSKLNVAVLGTPTDIAFYHNFISQLGSENIFKPHLDLLKTLKNTFKSKDLKEIAGHLGIIVEDMHYSIHEKADTFSQFKGTVGTALDKLSSLNLLGWQGDRARTSSAYGVGAAFGIAKHLEFKDLPPVLSQQLDRFGIKDYEWNLIKDHLQEIEGLKVLSMNSVRDIPDELIKPLAEKSKMGIGRFREQLSAKIGNLSNRFSRDMSPNANDATRASMYQGFGAGTVPGMFLRMLTQFQSYVFSLPRVYKTMLYLNPANKGKTLGEAFRNLGTAQKMAIFAVESTALAMLGYQLKQLAKGKEILPITDKKLWFDSIQSGAMPYLEGYLFDIFTGEYASDYTNLPQHLAGPTIGTAFDAAKLLSVGAYHLYAGEDLKKRDLYNKRIMSPQAAKVKALKLIRSNTPMVNLPIAKQVFDKYFFDALLERTKHGM